MKFVFICNRSFGREAQTFDLRESVSDKEKRGRRTRTAFHWESFFKN